MICVSIGRGRHRHMIAEHKHLVEQGAQLVELRLDYIARAVSLSRLLKDRPCPVVITVRRPADGGKWAGTEADRLMLLRQAIAEGVEYVDLEEDIAGQVPRFGKTKRIVSYHNFQETPDDLPALHARLAALDADVVKIATMAQSPADNLRMLRLVRDSEQPTAGLCMGEMGTPSRLLAGKFGAPFTYATFHVDRTMAPGQLSYQQMTEIYDYDRISPEFAVYGVVADPVAHSLSPHIHNPALRELGLNAVYVPFRVPREHLPGFLEDCRELGVQGLSVTIPHKEAVLPLAATRTPEVQGIGAANTLVLGPDGVAASNTDCQAAMASIASIFEREPENLRLPGLTALVLGSGGVSRAIAWGLKQAQAEVIITGRTQEKAEQLADDLDCRVAPWETRQNVKAGLIVNGTPIGMHPEVDATPLDARHLRPGSVVFDTVYNPEQTLLIKQARQQGCKAITGVEMFVRQAALQFERFTGQNAPFEVMREALKRTIGPVKY